MFLSPVPGSPAESTGTPVDYYMQTKQIFGCLTVTDDVVPAPMLSPSFRPKKRNKGQTHSSNDDASMEGFALKMPSALTGRPATPPRARGHHNKQGGTPGGRTAPPPTANVNPFDEPERCGSVTGGDALSRSSSVEFLSSTNREQAQSRSGLSSPDMALQVKKKLWGGVAPPAAPERRGFSAGHRAPMMTMTTTTATARGGGATEEDDDDDNNNNNNDGAVASRFRDDFEVLKTIGSGAFGTVHKVRSRLDGCLYAVKSTRARFKGATHREHTLKEVFALAALANNSTSSQRFIEGLQHVVRYYQAWIEDERLFIQTELCDASLEARLAAGRFDRSADHIFDFLRQMLLALQLIHAKELVHLDIKPGNIFVKGDAFKLGDFGLVTRAKTPGTDVVEGDSRYMSRELLDEDEDLFAPAAGYASPRSRDLTNCDIFSLGATAYEIARERSLPPNGPEWHAIRDGRANLAPTPACPAALVRLIAAMMHPRPHARPTATDLLEEPELLSESQKLALQLRREKQHVEALQQERNTHLRKQRLSRSNTWA